MFVKEQFYHRLKNYLKVFTELDCKTVRIFAYSSMGEHSNKKVWNEAENRERGWGETLSRLTRLLARVRLLRQALPISLLILRKKRLSCSLSQNRIETPEFSKSEINNIKRKKWKYADRKLLTTRERRCTSRNAL